IAEHIALRPGPDIQFPADHVHRMDLVHAMRLVADAFPRLSPLVFENIFARGDIELAGIRLQTSGVLSRLGLTAVNPFFAVVFVDATCAPRIDGGVQFAVEAGHRPDPRSRSDLPQIAPGRASLVNEDMSWGGGRQSRRQSARLLPVPDAGPGVELAVVHHHRLYGEMQRVIAEPSAIDPFLAPREPEHFRLVLCLFGTGNSAIQAAVEHDQTGNVGVREPRFAVVVPLAEVAVVDAEVDMPRVRHAVVSGSAAGDVKVDPAPLPGIEL